MRCHEPLSRTVVVSPDPPPLKCSLRARRLRPPESRLVSAVGHPFTSTPNRQARLPRRCLRRTTLPATCTSRLGPSVAKHCAANCLASDPVGSRSSSSVRSSIL